jgi:multidrug resistance efflux pump
MSELRLPALDEDAAPATGMIRHAVTILLLILAMLAAIAVVVATVITVDVTVEAAGTLEPTRIWPVRSRESGTIIETLVTSGDSVRRGQLLGRLDPLQQSSTIAGLRTRIAELRLLLKRDSSAQRVAGMEAEEQLRLASIALVRARALLRQKLVDFGLPDDVDALLRSYHKGRQVVLDLAVADLEEAESRVRANELYRERAVTGELDLARQFATLRGLQHELEMAELRAERLHLNSPAKGVVLSEQVHQLIGRRVQEGDVVLEIAEQDAWQAVLSLTEKDVHKVRMNDPVKLEIGALSSAAERLSGRITHVGQQPQTMADGTTAGGAYRVVVAIDGAAEPLRRGYTVRAHIIARSGRIIRLVWDYVTER